MFFHKDTFLCIAISGQDNVLKKGVPELNSGTPFDFHAITKR
jgi:hypothetical protein